MEALSLYAKLMNEDPVYAMYAKLQSQQYYMQQPGSAAQPVKTSSCSYMTFSTIHYSTSTFIMIHGVCVMIPIFYYYEFSIFLIHSHQRF